ncbi:hypothetical protein E2C01_051109 [Portunus trituberculatus]|uniref:Uncharacterized protein n=1 Tax=Portunus trituberculatus TaxID=210409 RepID=A0A5B7GIA0_PORTR|nr:hypothetical protein [Portunus trituberculatus]
MSSWTSIQTRAMLPLRCSSACNDPRAGDMDEPSAVYLESAGVGWRSLGYTSSLVRCPGPMIVAFAPVSGSMEMELDPLLWTTVTVTGW